MYFYPVAPTIILSPPSCAPQAYRKLEELQKMLPSLNISYYVSQGSLEALQRAVGLPLGKGALADHGDRRDSGGEEDEVEEDETLESHQGD